MASKEHQEAYMKALVLFPVDNNGLDVSSDK